MKPNVIRDSLSQKISIKPHQGMMVIMRGDRCLHGVGPLEGEQERINIVMAYASPDAQFPVKAGMVTENGMEFRWHEAIFGELCATH